MKLIKNIIAAAAALVAAAACTIVGEDTFSKAPVAPVLDSHSDILVTEETKTETVTFTWTAARFIEAQEYLYNLHVQSGEKAVVLKEGIRDAYCTVDKEEFRTFLRNNFELEQNATHSLSVYVTIADDNGKVYKSDPLSVKVYFYDNAVPPTVTAEEESMVLDKENPSGELTLLSWTAARLVYGEDVTYKVTVTCGAGEETVLAEGLYDTFYATTVDALNEAVIAAGAAEGAESELTLKVYACCESLSGGVEATNAAKIKITTYIATFPEKMWLPGNTNGWDFAAAPTLSLSSKVKGMYQGFVELTTADGADAEFKFSPVAAWEGDFGFENVEVTAYGEGELAYSCASSTEIGKSNIKVPSGLYYIKLDKKFGTLTMVQVKNLELIGSFAASNWADVVTMTRDGSSWKAASDIELKNGDKIVIRFNSAWNEKFGGEPDNLEFGGADIVFDKADGTYRLTLNASTADFTLNAMDVNMPDYLEVIGDFAGHGWNGTPNLRVNLMDSGTGLYKGYVTMYNPTYGFKFVKNGEIWYGQKSDGAGGYILGEDGFGNFMFDNGSYYLEVSLSAMTAKAVALEKVGMIGSFEASGWSSDVEMTFDETALTWSAEVSLKAGDEYKFRFNGNWDYNLGLSDGVLIQNGGNIKVESDGTYLITLDMAHGTDPTFTAVAK